MLLHLHLCLMWSECDLTFCRGDLADRIRIHPQCILSAFTPVLSFDQVLPECNPIT